MFARVWRFRDFFARNEENFAFAATTTPGRLFRLMREAIISGHYNFWLVALSVFVAICASYTALNLAVQTTAARGRARLLWLSGGACSMGMGIWAMHYVAMLAFYLPVSVAYHLPTVLASLLAAFVASGVALYVVSRPHLRVGSLVLGSLLMASGICAMHYTGMAAMRLPATINYNVWIVAASVVIAVGVSSVALWIAFSLRIEEKGPWWIRVASAVVMGFAICSMHYTGMAAACFRETGIPCSDKDAVSISMLGASGIALLALFVLAVALVTGAVNRRFALQERALALREQESRLFFEDNISAVCRTTIGGRILAANALFVTQLGFSSEEEVLGMNFWDLYTAPAERDDVYKEVLRSKKVRGCQIQFKDRHGNSRWKLVNYALLDSAAPPEIIATSMDITDLKRVQEELLQAKEKAEAAAVSKSKFLANMSHELRTPLNAILGLTDLVLEGPLTAEHRESLEIVKSSGENLLKLINDVLDFSKLEAKRLELHLEDFSLRRLVQQTVEFLSVTLRGKDVRMHATFAESIPETLVGDAFRLRQVLMNLLGNAIKFTQRGEIVARVESLTPIPEGYTVTISVRDTGIGIPAKKINSIFDSFTQAETSTSKRFGGTGLGLCIVRELVIAMGGDIRVESVEGQGSTFYFTAVLGLPKIQSVTAEDLVALSA